MPFRGTDTFSLISYTCESHEKNIDASPAFTFACAFGVEYHLWRGKLSSALLRHVSFIFRSGDNFFIDLMGEMDDLAKTHSPATTPHISYLTFSLASFYFVAYPNRRTRVFSMPKKNRSDWERRSQNQCQRRRQSGWRRKTLIGSRKKRPYNHHPLSHLSGKATEAPPNRGLVSTNFISHTYK